MGLETEFVPWSDEPADVMACLRSAQTHHENEARARREYKPYILARDLSPEGAAHYEQDVARADRAAAAAGHAVSVASAHYALTEAAMAAFQAGHATATAGENNVIFTLKGVVIVLATLGLTNAQRDTLRAAGV